MKIIKIWMMIEIMVMRENDFMTLKKKCRVKKRSLDYLEKSLEGEVEPLSMFEEAKSQ